MFPKFPDSWNAVPVASPQKAIQVLGKLQKYTISTIPSTIYIYDLVDQCNIYSSCSLAAMLGYTVAEIQNMGTMGYANLIHPDDLQQVSEHFQRFATLLDGEVIEIEYRMKRADGAWRWLRSQETLFLQAIDGFPLQVLGIVQDITTYKNDIEAQAIFSYVIEHMSEMVMVTDLEGVIIHVNRAFEELTGYDRSNAIGKTPAILKSGQHSISFYRQLWNTLHQGEVFHAEFINRKQNGDLFREDKTITPIKNKQGNITHFLAMSKILEECQPAPQEFTDRALNSMI